jgi:hypothetical protein
MTLDMVGISQTQKCALKYVIYIFQTKSRAISNPAFEALLVLSLRDDADRISSLDGFATNGLCG